MRSIRYFFHRVARLVSYLPVIWRTHEWDYNYVLDILQFSLDRMSKSIRKYGIHVKAAQDADDMAWAARMIRRQMNDEYFDEASAEFEKKWGKVEIVCLDCGDLPAKEMLTYHEKADTPELHLQADEEYREVMLQAMAAEEKEWKELWRFISKHMRGWWD